MRPLTEIEKQEKLPFPKWLPIVIGAVTGVLLRLASSRQLLILPSKEAEALSHVYRHGPGKGVTFPRLTAPSAIAHGHGDQQQRQRNQSTQRPLKLGAQ